MVNLVISKGAVIKQMSPGTKRVINADDQHSSSENELGLRESRGPSFMFHEGLMIISDMLAC